VGSALKGIGLICLVLILFIATGEAGPNAPLPQSDHSAALLSIGAFAVAMRAVQNTYDGWNNGIYFCEEMHAPERHIPGALFGGIALVGMLYLLVNASLLYSLGPAGMAASKLPAAQALANAIGPWAGTMMTLLGIVSVAAILNLNVMFGPRIALAMSRNGVLPRKLASVRPNGSPFAALTVGSAGAALLAASGTYEELIAFNVALGFLVNSSVCLAALRLRRTEADLPRPWKMPAYPLPVLIAVLVNLVLLAAMIREDAFHSLAGIAAAVAIGLAYRGLRARKAKPA
jgi:APA family basic amino acid/polyamine antiporter